MGAVPSMTDEDPLVHVDILIHASQRRRVRENRTNLSEFVREKLDESFS
jgi:hypothetical protein